MTCNFTINHVNAASDSAALSVVGLGSQPELAATLTHSGASKGNLNWTLFDESFVAANSTSTLSITSLDSPTNTNGLLLDAISVTPVPEPTSILLGAVVLLCTGCRPRRQQT